MILHTARREQVDLGPSHGRLAGVRGSNLGGSYLITVMKPAEPRIRVEAASRRTIREDEPRCGAILKVIGEPCARRPEHRGSHRSKETMQNDAGRRRTGKPNGRPRP